MFVVVNMLHILTKPCNQQHSVVRIIWCSMHFMLHILSNIDFFFECHLLSFSLTMHYTNINKYKFFKRFILDCANYCFHSLDLHAPTYYFARAVNSFRSSQNKSHIPNRWTEKKMTMRTCFFLSQESLLLVENFHLSAFLQLKIYL